MLSGQFNPSTLPQEYRLHTVQPLEAALAVTLAAGRPGGPLPLEAASAVGWAVERAVVDAGLGTLVEVVGRNGTEAVRCCSLLAMRSQETCRGWCGEVCVCYVCEPEGLSVPGTGALLRWGLGLAERALGLSSAACLCRACLSRAGPAGG